jgi:glutathione synthase/RimK-type ligase-like ATP-grasp enzyme
VGAPLAPIHVFYTLPEALAWIDGTTFPKVFKLRKGAGSRNVRLVHDAGQARKLVRRAFGAGFKPFAGYMVDSATKTWKVRRKGEVWRTLKRLPTTLLSISRANRLLGREKGYVYFQDFMAGNTFDTRVTIIGNRAFAFTRDVRPEDFRASGSGRIVYDLDRVDLRCVRAAFDVTRKIGAQSLAFDFVRNATGEPRIVEVSYTYLAKPVYDCRGQWDDRLGWHEGHVWPQDAILEDLLNSLGR